MSEIDFGRIKSTEIFGYSPVAAIDLASKIAAGYQPSQLPGDFVLIIKGQCQNYAYEAVVISAVCVVPYYFYAESGKFAHGKDIFEVVRQAQIGWQWNENALSSMVTLSLCLGNDSLHQQVQRVDPATVYYYRQGELTIVRDSYPTNIFTGNPFDADNALEIYNDICDEYYSDRPVCMSLSAGYDSRVLLASLLKRGIKPPVGTEGAPDSIDVITAQAIAKDFGLEHRTIELSEHDFINHAEIAVEATSGELLMSGAWGSYMFLQQVEFPADALHLAGTNGGLFKANFSNQKLFYQVADLLPDPILKQFFYAYQIYKQRQYKGFSLKAFCWNQQALKFSTISDRCYQLAKVVPNFSSQVDYFHSFYRVRNYTGRGLGLYNLVNLTSSPFLDYRMVEVGARLAKKYKINCSLHQHILLNSYPQLAEYPMNGKNISPTRSTQHAGLEQLAQQPTKRKSLNARLMDNTQLREIYYDSPYLDYFMTRKDRHIALDKNIFAVFSFLLTMHYVADRAAQIK